MAADRNGPGPQDNAMGTGAPGPDGGRQSGRDHDPGVQGGGTTGTTGFGNSATGRPGFAREGQTEEPQRVEPSPEDKARGVKEEHAVSILSGQNSAARDAGLPGSAGSGSSREGDAGSGSTVGGPATIGPDVGRGTVGGTRGQGVGGTVPAPDPIADSPARGAGVPNNRLPDDAGGQGRAGMNEDGREGGKLPEDRAAAAKSLDSGGTS